MKKDKLGNLVNIKTGKLDANASSQDGIYPFFTCSKDPLKINSFSYDCKCVLVAGNGDLNVKYYEGKFDAYQRTYIIESKDESILNTRYLYYFLSKYIEKLRELSIGGVIKYIKINNLTDPIISLPPLGNQRCIVKILDQADALIQKRKQAIDLLDEYLKSVFLEMFGDPIKNNKKWKIEKLFNSIITIKNGLTRRGGDRKKEKDIVLRLKDIRSNFIEFKDLDKITLNEKEKTLFQAKQNDLLFIRVNGNPDYVGRCAVFNGYIEPVFYNDHIMRVRLKTNSLNPVFLAYFLNSSFGKSEISKYRKTSAGQYTINQEGLSRIKLYVPDISFQRQFVTIVGKVEIVRQKMVEQSEKLENNFQALMQKAFRGEL